MDIKQFNLDENTYLKYRDTPWDEKSLGLGTVEITEIQGDLEPNLHQLIQFFDNYQKLKNKQLAYCRVRSSQQNIARALQQNGYYFVETSFNIGIHNLKSLDFHQKYKKILPLREPYDEEYLEIENIAKNSFHYGRFHEDVSIDQVAARERYKNWVRDMRDQGKPFLVYVDKGVLISFISFMYTDDSIELILGGSKEGYGAYSPFFWASFLTRFKQLGVNKISTLISASNISIVNLYSSFGFTVKETLFGFHKRYSR